MKRYITTLGLLAFIGGLFFSQVSSIQSYAANSVKTATFSNADNFRQDTVPRSDTAKHKKWKHKTKGDSSWPKKDTIPH
ncbi:hypothetical protein SAMN05518672_103505 [Chitinophaga sp. CF118]|uniref:hypothetical protein n=1 Tax=Chitinophaga sp. CF118 TaxID=1884367 RepID=UPI0008E44F00|nr:hypothetical protein [Chitinophaga sp. CF118]SFD85032.1 hypothetical protein SAMN05518672_103505 [Chitinophaga sp. CF118]